MWAYYLYCWYLGSLLMFFCLNLKTMLMKKRKSDYYLLKIAGQSHQRNLHFPNHLILTSKKQRNWLSLKLNSKRKKNLFSLVTIWNIINVVNYIRKKKIMASTANWLTIVFTVEALTIPTFFILLMQNILETILFKCDLKS